MARKAAIRNFTMVLAASGSALAYTAPASADALDPYIGEIMQAGFNFCPRGWAQANGQILPIAQNTALFSLLGTTYGGNGQTTFALPNFAGRSGNAPGSGPGLSPYVLGELAGAETTTLTTANLAKHDHRAGIQTANATANATTANGNALGVSSNNSFVTAPPDPAGNLMDRTMVQVQPTGGSQPITNRPPYLALKYCIALEGIFPARN
jgi:microcystin-dependent protein